MSQNMLNNQRSYLDNRRQVINSSIQHQNGALDEFQNNNNVLTKKRIKLKLHLNLRNQENSFY